MAVHRRFLRVLLIVAVAAVVSLAAGCRTPRGTPRLGFAYPSGPGSLVVGRVAQKVIDSWQPVRVAEVFISAGRLPQSTETAGNVAIADRILQTPLMAGVAGHLSSRATLIVAPIYSEARIPLVVPTSTSRRIGHVGEWVFQLAPDEDAEGEFLVGFAVEKLQAKRITIVYVSADEYGTGLRDGVVAALRRRGLQPADQLGILEDSDHDRLLSISLGRATPDALVLAIRGPEAARIVQSARQRLPGVPLVAGDGVVLGSGPISLPAVADTPVYAAAFWHPDVSRAESQAFVERCRALGDPQPSGSDAMFYDALMVLATAVRASGGGSEAVRQYLSELGASRPAYAGVTGPISFSANRPTNLVMTRVLGGRVVIAAGR